MARTVLVAALTALAVSLGLRALTQPITIPPPPAAEEAAESAEVLRRLTTIEGHVDQLVRQADQPPPRLEGHPEANDPRVEALEARVAGLVEQMKEAEGPNADVAEARKQQRDSDAQLERWIKALHDKSESVAFSATLELGRLKDPRATDPLIATLRHHNDFYVRLGAATGLGDMRALDAVPYLIDALGDKDSLVRTAANDALQEITEGRIDFAPDFDAEQLKQAQEAWRQFWLDNETRLRAD